MKAFPLRMRIAAEAGLLIAFTVVCLLYFDLFVRDGYTRSSLQETQIEARDLARLLSLPLRKTDILLQWEP